ncbi:MAG TPA: GNAT family N-acetyltransferase, partial [Rhodoferax sp.]|nr:GNAT family N-acetyltransferase [Rhodoferax sp.]
MTYDAGAQMLEIAGTVFTLRDVGPSDCTAVLGLHRRVFGSTVDAAWFDWKYRHGGGEAVGLWQGNELVAHCGGTPRTVLHHGRPARDLQIGDVMVAPEWRGVLRRRGPFYHVSERLYSSRLG